MPLHDLKRLQMPGDDSIYHHFHYLWVASIANYLNRTFPEELGFEAVCEKHVTPLEADVVTIDDLDAVEAATYDSLQKFQTSKPFMVLSNPEFPEDTKDIRVQTTSGQIIAVIELTSPGNKNAEQKVNNYVANAIAYLRQGLNYLVIDALPPTKFVDNFHNAIAEVLNVPPIAAPKDRPYYAISYRVCLKKNDVAIEVYPHWFGLGELLPAVPLFLVDNLRIGVDLEGTFMEVIQQLRPNRRRILLES
jgi:hypothetical protein